MKDTDYESSIWKLKLGVKEADVLCANKCLTEILKIVENQDSVPSNLVKEFFGYLLDTTDLLELKEHEREEKAQSIVSRAKSRLSKNGFLFEGFDKMIQSCVYSYFLLKQIPTKKDMIHILYFKTKEFKPPYDTRKKSIVIGFLLSEFGLIPAYIDKVKNKEWIQAPLTLKDYLDSCNHFVTFFEENKKA